MTPHIHISIGSPSSYRKSYIFTHTREKNLAEIYKRGDAWHYRGTIDGERVRAGLGTSNYKEALKNTRNSLRISRPGRRLTRRAATSHDCRLQMQRSVTCRNVKAE